MTRKKRYFTELLGLILLTLSLSGCQKEKYSANYTNSSYSKVGGVGNGSLASHIGVFPNPCENILYVDISLDKEENVKINLLGKVEFNKMLSAGGYNIEIDLTDKKSGLYYLEIEIGNHVERIKILKK